MKVLLHKGFRDKSKCDRILAAASLSKNRDKVEYGSVKEYS